MINTQCFAFNDVDCKCLKVLVCKKKPCRFSKSSAELENSSKKSFERIKNLSKEQQSCISEKYFQGKKPWNKE